MKALAFILFLSQRKISMKLQPLIICLCLLLNACGTKKLGEPVGIEIRLSKDAQINYGHSFRLSTYLKYSKGGEKDISSKSGLDYIVKGAQYSSGKVSIDKYPVSFRKDTIFVTATYVKKELNFTTQKAIPFNYKGDLELSFNGTDGEEGTKGSDGGTALLFRDGKDGDDGYSGSDGTNGHDITVHIYKNAEDDLYYMRVTDLNSSKMFFYKTKDVGYPIKFHVNGGKGGRGGSGGDGGSGKDGKSTDKKTKRPGNGGNGGNGGIGGSGGSGGSVYVFLHPSAADIQSRITAISQGGYPGDAGAGGKAGSPGTPLEGQDPAEPGIEGSAGSVGAMGASGMGVQFSVEDFDIDF